MIHPPVYMLFNVLIRMIEFGEEYMPSLPVGKPILLYFTRLFLLVDLFVALYNISSLYCSKCHLAGAREFSVVC